MLAKQNHRNAASAQDELVIARTDAFSLPILPNFTATYYLLQHKFFC